MPVSSRGANYWVDVVFAAQSNGGTAPQLPSVSAGSAALIDADTSETIWSVAATTRRPMASTTKGMTLLLLYELLGPDLASKTVTVPYAATTLAGTTAGLVAGEQISAEELAYGLMLPSGNDAAYTIAHHIGVALGAAPGQAAVDLFVARMNQRAAQLGLTDTQFKNPHGLDAVGHYTTALDLAKMYRAIFAVPKLQQIAGTVSYLSPGGRGWDNSNNLLGALPGTIAGKNGFSAGAKQCLAVLYGRAGKRFIGVVLGADDRSTDMVSALEYGNRLYALPSEKQYGRSNSYHAAPSAPDGDTPGWYKSGLWPHYIDGYGHWSTTVGSKATYKFYGTGVKMITSTGPAWGRVDVALDGGAAAMVDLYSPGSNKKGVEVWSASGLTAGWHTLTITPRQDRNPAATDRIAVLDEFWTER
jgi:D-alanyl-D-alanine carboxypeptidase